MTAMVRTGWILVLAACGGQPNVAKPNVAQSSDRNFECPERSIGDRSLYTIAASDSIAAPQTCASSQPDEAYIRVSGSGTRPFSVSSPGKETGCTTPDVECTTVDLGSFLRAVGAKLRARGVDPVSTVGMGTCGKVGDRVTWEDRHMSIVVYHWKHANDAVAILDDELRAWNVSQSYEVSVERIPCGHSERLTARAGARSAQRGWQEESEAAARPSAGIPEALTRHLDRWWLWLSNLSTSDRGL